MVERINFGLEEFDDDELDQAKKIESKDKKDDEKEKRPRISLDSLFETKKVDEEDESPKKLEDLFVSNKKEAEIDETEEIDESSSETEDHAISSEQSPNDDQEGLDEVAELDSEETVHVAQQIEQQHLEELETEFAETEGSAEQDAVLAEASLTEKVLEKLEDAPEVTDELLDEALAETAAELELVVPENELEDNTEIESDEDYTEQHEDEPEAPTEDNNIVKPVTPVTAPPASIPPAGPTPPAGTPPSGSPPGGISSPVSQSIPNRGANTPPGAESPKAEQDKHSHVPYVLAGGIVGYLIGRRRGRIKSEKQLIPIQNKLEKEVQNLGSKLAEREEKIRNLARQKHYEKPLNQSKVVENLNQKAEERLAKNARFSPNELSTTPQREQLKPELQQPVHRPESMTLAELLAVAGNVQFEKVNLKTMFEQGRLDIHALRRVVKEYLQSGNYEHELRRSLKPEQTQQSPEVLRQTQNIEQFEPPHEQAAANLNIESEIQQRYGIQATTPQIGMYGNSSHSAKPTVVKNKLAMAIGGTVFVVVLAVVVALILLALL